MLDVYHSRAPFVSVCATGFTIDEGQGKMVYDTTRLDDTYETHLHDFSQSIDSFFLLFFMSLVLSSSPRDTKILLMNRT